MANSVIIIFLLIIPRLSELRRLRRMQDYWQQTKFSMKFSVKSWWHKGPIFPRIVNRVVGCPCLGDNQQFRILKNCVGLQDFSWAQNTKQRCRYPSRYNIQVDRYPSRYDILVVVTGSRVIPWTHLDGGQNVPSPWQLHFGSAPARPLPTRNARTSNCDEKHHEPPTRGSGLNAAGPLNSTFQFLHICTRLHQSQSRYLLTCI